MNSTGFTWKKKRSRRDGYGNRCALICDTCGETVIDGDPGNGAGFRYFYAYADAAVREHREKGC